MIKKNKIPILCAIGVMAMSVFAACNKQDKPLAPIQPSVSVPTIDTAFVQPAEMTEETIVINTAPSGLNPAITIQDSLSIIESWFSDIITSEWTETPAGSSFYSVSANTNSATVTIVYQNEEYSSTLFQIHNTEKENIFASATELLSAYLGRSLTQEECDILSDKIDHIINYPDDITDISQFGGAALSLYMNKSENQFYIRCE